MLFLILLLAGIKSIRLNAETLVENYLPLIDK
jgi:hypothetical protein